MLCPESGGAPGEVPVTVIWEMSTVNAVLGADVPKESWAATVNEYDPGVNCRPEVGVGTVASGVDDPFS